MDQPVFPRAKFESGEPVHAQAPEHGIDFVDLIGLILGGGQSPNMGDLDLIADLSLDAARFMIDGRRYELSLRRVRVLVEKENADIEPQSFYTAVLQSGQIASSEQTTTKSATSLSASAEAGAEAEAGLTGFLLKVIGKGSAKGARERSTETTQETKRATTVDFIRQAGQNSVVVGGPQGDPRRETRDLRGAMFTDDGAGNLVPLCGLVAKDSSQPVRGRVTIRASDEDFVISDDGRAAAARETLFAAIKDEASKAWRRRVKAEEELKSRIAGLAARKPFLRNERRPSETEVDLASCAFLFVARD